MEEILGIVHTEVKVTSGVNWEGQEVVEIRASYHANEHHSQNTVIVLDIETASRLAYLLEAI